MVTVPCGRCSTGDDLLKRLVRSLTPAPIWNTMIQAKAAYLRPRGRRSWSEYGEDLVILSELKRHTYDLSSIRYLDIGAFDPFFLSHTYLLYSLGARGILVEPSPEEASRLRRKRPRDTVVEAAVSPAGNGNGKLFRLTAGVYNTLDQRQAERVVEDSQTFAEHDRQQLRDVIDVDLISINDLIREHFDPGALHLVTIDTEGQDLKIIQSIDWPLMTSRMGRPFIIMAERVTATEHYVAEMPPGFDLVCQTPGNLIFVKS